MNNILKPNTKLACSTALAVAMLSACSMGSSVPLSGDNAKPVVASTPYNLPKLMLEIKWDEDKFNLTTHYVRDPDHLYAFDYTGSFLSDDILTVTREKATGFVSKIDASADDKSSEIAQKITDTIISVNAKRVGTPQLTNGETIEEFFDYFDPHKDLDRINKRLEKAGASFRIKCDDCRAPTPTGRVVEGIYTRPMTTAVIRIQDAATGDLLRYASVDTPNGSPLVALPLPRSAGVKRTVVYTDFKNGDPGSVVINKPSEGLGVVTGITGVVGAVIAAPVAAAARVLTEETAKKDAFEAKTKRIEAEAASRQAEADLLEQENARNAALNAKHAEQNGETASTNKCDDLAYAAANEECNP